MMEQISQTLHAMIPTRTGWAVLDLMLVITLIMMIWERRFPAHFVDHRRTWRPDLGAALACFFFLVPAADAISAHASFSPVLPAAVFRLPFAVRFAMFLVVGDFGYYWVHRAMHSKWLWPVHRWHHSPTHMYWLVGARGSLIQQVLVNSPYIFAQSVLAVAPWWTGLAIAFKNTLQAMWMHLNVPWGSRWLEWLIVTPRYHHIHHSDHPQLYNANVSAIFPIWDHLFGTYVDPDKLNAPLGFGTNEKKSAVRLALGV